MIVMVLLSFHIFPPVQRAHVDTLVLASHQYRDLLAPKRNKMDVISGDILAAVYIYKDVTPQKMPWVLPLSRKTKL